MGDDGGLDPKWVDAAVVIVVPLVVGLIVAYVLWG